MRVLTCSTLLVFVTALIATTPSVSAPKAKPTASSAISFTSSRARMLRTRHLQARDRQSDQWKASKYMGITFGPKEYVYSWNGKFIKSQPAPWPTGGLIDSYAEVGFALLDNKMKSLPDTVGSELLKFIHVHNHWALIAWDDSKEGYTSRLNRAAVPESVIKRLKRWTVFLTGSRAG